MGLLRSCTFWLPGLCRANSVIHKGKEGFNSFLLRNFTWRSLVTKTIAIIATLVATLIVGSAMIGGFAHAKNENQPNPIAEAIDRLTDALLLTAVQGPEGPPGPQGERGPAGAISTYTVEETVEVSGGGVDRARVHCDIGDVATGGGYSLPSNMIVRGTSPMNSDGDVVDAPEPATWWVVFVSNQSSSPTIFIGYAVCADMTP